MPYDITTIGSLLGSCDCGKPQRLDVQKIAGIAETASGVFDRLNPFSEEWFVRDLARRAVQKIEDRAEALKQAADPMPPILDGIGVPTWGYHGDLITGAAILGALAVGGVVVYRMAKKKKNGSAPRAPRRKALRP